ncbi:hypothetical protein GGR46_003200 [Sphingomonas kyeonggiensis]|uniref:TniQ domain-containing protein n=2 Tax=Sphingomonas kyeonggiensis TaxID=1268553 RepID=A0A7W6JU49_9SPHN|nr:hypothetical protein [Sphingomonas kyeonggiensis]
MDTPELLKHDLGYDLGHDQVDDLDTSPPASLLLKINQRSGIDLDQLRCMSFAGWIPWLLDSLDDDLPDALRTYALQFSVLLPRSNDRPVPIKYWRAWLPIWPIHRACPLCLKNSADQALLLVWKLPLMLSCPHHGCWLETYHGSPGLFTSWEDPNCTPRPASDTIAAMDRRTWQALTAGYVDLSRRRIHAGVWFRLLRTLIEELITPLSQCYEFAGHIRYVWEQSGQPLRAGQRIWRRFENLALNVQLRTLEVAATAIYLLENRVLQPMGAQASLFVPERRTEFTNGLPAAAREAAEIARWDDAITVINDAIADARHNPDTARFLYTLAACGYPRNPESVERLLGYFDELEIPREFLPLNLPLPPFAGLR